MESISLAEAREQFGELVARAEAGESVEITRGGKRVARLVPPTAEPRGTVDWDAIERVVATMPPQPQPAGQFVREMRDAARY